MKTISIGNRLSLAKGDFAQVRFDASTAGTLCERQSIRERRRGVCEFKRVHLRSRNTKYIYIYIDSNQIGLDLVKTLFLMDEFYEHYRITMISELE